jgi:enterochelin esterase-like enzyme
MLLIAIFALAGCLPGEAVPPTPLSFTPAYTATFTVPPLPTSTTWATKTPRPTETPTATPLACWDDGGQVVEAEIPSAYQPVLLSFLVYLPPCYSQQPDRLYPTLYLIHGQSFTPQQWVRLGVVEIADSWIGAGDVGPFLMVMPQVANWDEPSGFSFDLILMEELLPYIEANYRTSPQRADRAVGGISRGASWAVHMGLKYWETFGAFGGHSLPVFIDDAPSVPFWLDAIPSDQYPRIYVDYADSDQRAVRRSASWFVEQLDLRGMPYAFSTAPGTHSEDYWGRRIAEYLAFYLAEW